MMFYGAVSCGLSKTVLGWINENISYERFPVAMWVWDYISVWVLLGLMDYFHFPLKRMFVFFVECCRCDVHEDITVQNQTKQ